MDNDVETLMKHPHCQWCADNVAQLNIWGNIALMVIKALSGFFGASRALIADAVHSLTDVITSFCVYVSLKLTNKSPDENYPYGYGHIEFVASGLIGVFLLMAGALIIWDSLMALISGDLPTPTSLAIAGEVISIAGNELMFHHGICIGEQSDSPAMISNAWENRMDAWTSLAALVGIVGAWLGYRFMDALAAVAVAACIIHTATWMLRLSGRGLMDNSLGKDFIDRLGTIASSVEGVKQIMNLKAKKSGQKIWVDMEVLVDPKATVIQTKSIKEKIKESTLKQVSSIAGIAVRFHPATY